MTVRILTVCTGNICRSPYAHLLLEQRLGDVRPGAFEVASAGVYALVGQGVDPGSIRHLETKRIDHHSFAARQLTEPVLADIDLVLAMSAEHRKAVLGYAPRLVKRAFTLKEMARLIDSAATTRPWAERVQGSEGPDNRWAEIVRQLAEERRRARHRGDDDLADPYRLGDEAFDAMADEVDRAVDRIVALEASFG